MPDMPEDPDRLLTVAVVGVAAVFVVALGVLGYVAASGDASTAEPMRDVQWRFDRVNDSHARIVHDGGPTVSPDGLMVSVDDIERHPTWRSETLSEGDSGVFRADAGSDVALLWERNRVDRVVLVRWTVPDGGEG
ncbi:hypothetical protein [Halobaculum roseum]|uniref:Archaeal Type IV pilin N-terminal domain-containing protein n=1 Tax=Halobaculum roseum TaxID=2175149 RepID=A0ABD5MH51_9EURY|nr:hypothetical protein [Halobaculum roseum]QZY02811.1 hypothetical protein K6T36_01015 [Halobaculum roseum]